jgi:pyrophosphatase PpaX
MIGRPLVEMFAVADPEATAEQIDAYITAYRTAWHPIAVPLSRPLPTMVETVNALTDRGIRLGVVTSRVSSGAERILEAFGLRDRFGSIVGVERVEEPKPHAEAVLLALDELGATPTTAVMVGDTPDDVLAGRNAGARSVGITTGVYSAEALEEAGADHVIERLEQLLPLL